ncbi:MAG: hypothetical protein J2P45_25570 [Candidatus Dormibacteraeota bacterium]|nr:hypothetical protein [Candidatus Dormibacteraeota bacterium]
MKPPEGAYRFGPLERRGFLAGLRLSQVAALALGTAVCVLAVASSRSPSAAAAAIAAAVLVVAATFVRVGAGTADQWLPLAVRQMWRRIRGRDRHLSVAPLLGHTHRGGPPVSPPDSLDGVSLVSVEDPAALPVGVPAGIGVLRDERAGTCTGVLRVRGRGFTLLDPGDQAREVEAWSGILAALGREQSLARRLQWIERTLPETGETAARHLGESVRLPFSDQGVEAYLSLLEESRASSRVHETLVALQLDRARAARAGEQRDDPELGAYVTLTRELESLAARLQESGLQVEGALPPRALALALRLAFEPNAAGGLALLATSRGLPGIHPDGAWPLATACAWSHFRAGAALHAAYWVREWPRTPVGPDFLAPLLLQTSCARTVAMVMEPIPPHRARREAEAARVADASDEQMRRRAGFVTSARRSREQEQVLAREGEIADGHSDLRFSAYVLASAASGEELHRACAEVEQQAAQARLELARLDGAHDLAFTYCLPLGRGLA